MLRMNTEINLLKKYWQKPSPNIEKFKKVVRRENIGYLPFVELGVDEEVMKFVTERYFGRKWVEPGSNIESEKLYWENVIHFYYKMGYDYVMVWKFMEFPKSMRKGEDTASLSRVQRDWTVNKGIISSWEDFERYPWPEVKESFFWFYKFVSQNLPEGMGIIDCPLGGGVLDYAMNILVGYETLCYLLYDDPKLVEAIFEKIGKILLDSYKMVIGLDKLAGFIQGDDMGFKTATLVSPEVLRKYVLPWHKKFAQLAHDNGLFFIIHNCGYCESIMDDLIEDVSIDGKHSFEDTIMPVTDFKKKYGERIAVVGGVDMNKLSSLTGKKLQRYIQGIIKKCDSTGGYLLGSGNTIANYVPVENYFLMLEEGLRQRNKN